ncbi:MULTISPECIES: EamA/RhaT family transporter [unclassified Psychrobacter]|uniref:EamA/RhaT family transporter n=1 Tax=unclassified Psychrobacter TaxID=196806 RepID=UPI0019198800|nr:MULTISPECIES: EamA/RhaT family transporter [unclassified Psychrobacter]|tara:strand:+ start:20588 stop:21436 length:849 start_codon:yes stop_codon:yes gene_type:complete
MMYLTIAVLCSVAVSVLLKILRQRDIDIRQTIVAGYPVAFLLTWFLLKPDVSGMSNLGGAWAIIIGLGVLLPAVFIILGRAIEAIGMVATDAAQRLSLIIPIVAAFLLFGEVLTGIRVFGLLLGFLALGALIYRPQQGEISKQAKHTPLWLFGVWAGYGVIDILFKQVAKQGAAFPLTLFVSFGLAGLLLLIYLLIMRVRWQGNALAAGILLGALNMGNIYAYIRAHQVLSESPSIVFTGMNVGVIAVATLIGVGVFKESLNRINILGLLLAIFCVAVLFLA